MAKNYNNYTTKQLEEMRKANSANWHGASKDQQAALHDANVEINKILDSRNGTSSSYDSHSGTWSSKPSSTSTANRNSGTSGTGSYSSSVSYPQSNAGKTPSYLAGLPGSQQNVSGDTDYSILLGDAMRAGASADEVQRLLSARVNKALGNQNLQKYAYDDVYSQAMQYIRDNQTPVIAYEDKYSDRIDELLNGILNRDDFSYNALEDPLYQQYRDQYRREGDRAMQDALGQLSARTGGLASSWAGTAAQQQGDYYASMASDKIPELYQLAYSMYMDDLDSQVRDLGLLEQMSSSQYNRYRDTVDDWRSDRSFAYNKYRDDVGDARYGDELSYNRDTYASETEYDRALEKAQTLAAFGDFSGYQALGYSPEEIARMQGAYALSQSPTYSGSGSRGGGRGGSSGGASSQPSEDEDIYQTLYDAGVRTEGDAYARLLNMGYTSGVAGKIAAYFAENMNGGSSGLKGSGSGAKGSMSDSYFSAMMTSVEAALRQGRAEDVTDGLDGAWGRLSPGQRNKLQNLLGRYGYQYTGG